jgi:2-amino-4-hydroxy-6-hydroxymethyldihydropteridine pyrophosphokinase
MPPFPSNVRVTDAVYVALGSNLGNRAAYLAAARSAISLTPGVRLLAASAVEETVPFGNTVQGPYLNQMMAVETTLLPDALLVELQRIELALGRVRDVRWGPRTIDLDIVAFDDAQSNTSALQLPHPGLADRVFWQRERAELMELLRS